MKKKNEGKNKIKCIKEVKLKLKKIGGNKIRKKGKKKRNRCAARHRQSRGREALAKRVGGCAGLY